MSDHEVNIKIMLDLLLHNGTIANRDEKTLILCAMTDEVSSLVLAEITQARRSRWTVYAAHTDTKTS